MQDASFKIYNASAGSGKTFSLVRDYLSLLFSAKKTDAFRSILAITFTNKAVAEMKSRIVENLIAFSKDNTHEDYLAMLNAVANTTNISPDLIKTRSVILLKKLIHNYAAFEISTIDGFTHRVLRTFAKDLGLPSNFEVTMQVDDILHEAVDKLIAKAGEDKELTKVLINFALSKADEDKSWDISRELYSIAKLLTNETNLDHLKALESKDLDDFKTYTKTLNDQKKDVSEALKQIAEDVFSLLNEQGIAPEHAFTGKYAYKYFTSLKKGNFSELKFTAAWQKNLLDDSKPIYSKTSKDLTKEQKSILDGLNQPIASYFKASKDKVLLLSFIDHIANNIIPLSLLNSIKKEVEAIKKERGLLLISEFNNTIGNAIKGQPAPFIYERLGERYRHFFIDEFQDTSELQWQNLIPLAENPLVSLDEDRKQGSLLLVGDAKQSIYRWRGGKAEQFIDLYNKKSPFSITPEVSNLPNNFRSLPQVVQFNNALFKHIAQYFKVEDYQNLYEKSPQDIVKKEKGYVNLKFFDLKNKEEEHEVFPEEVLNIIKECEALGYNKSDICILSRKRKEGVIIADYLSEQGISIISSETLLVKNSKDVQFIIDVLKLLKNPKDDITKVNLLNYLVDTGKVKEEATQFILESLKLDSEAFYSSLELHGINFKNHLITSLALYDALEYIISSFNLSSTSNAYIQYFLDFAFDYGNQNVGGIHGFLDHWSQHEEKLSIVVPKGEDAVQLLTIHRAKGLEFPVVIYPYASDNILDTRMDNIWINLNDPYKDIPKAYISASSKLETLDESMAAPYEQLLNEKQMDGVNVLYVALTRAKEQLYILSKKDINSKGVVNTKTVAGLLIDYLMSKGSWDNSETSFHFGEPHNKVSVDALLQQKTNTQTKVETLPFSERAITLSTNSGRLWGTTQQEAIDEGILIHDLMAIINSVLDINTAINLFIDKGILASSDKLRVKEKIQSIVSHPELSEFFKEGNTNLNEKDLVSENGKILRPDRINFLQNNTAVVIDYKTGVFNEQNERQVKEYTLALENMGYTVSKTILVYTNESLTIKNV
jgi:ATP-dependent exoDNAse (exonuclease V) beta subunit